MSRTRVIVLAAFIVLGIYDAIVVSAGNTDASISQFITNLVDKGPFAYGVMCIVAGHLLFPMSPKHIKK